MKRFLFLAMAVFSLAAAVPANAAVLQQLNLNDFFHESQVTVSADGLTASFSEDPGLMSILLSDDPWLGDPLLITGAVGTKLVFDYEFSELNGGDDEFAAFLYTETEFPAGPAFEFFLYDSGSGTVEFDLSPLAGVDLGLDFQLNSMFGDQTYDSTLIVSNVRIETTAAPVPEPATMLLMGAGMAVLAARGKKTIKHGSAREI